MTFYSLKCVHNSDDSDPVVPFPLFFPFPSPFHIPPTPNLCPHFANTLGHTKCNRGMALFWCEEDSTDQLLTAMSRMSGCSGPYCGQHTIATN